MKFVDDDDDNNNDDDDDMTIVRINLSIVTVLIFVRHLDQAE